jgi:hypothetical protein
VEHPLGVSRFETKGNRLSDLYHMEQIEGAMEA